MGVAPKISVKPTARHAADLVFIPIIVADACGAGHDDAARRSLKSLRFAIITDVAVLTALMAG